MFHLCIVPGCNVICAYFLCVLQKWSKLYFSVAQNIWVWRSSFFVFFQKVRKNSVPIFFGIINRKIGNSNFVTNKPNIFVICLSGAMPIWVLFFPIFHKKSNNIVTLFF